ncbi:uncharacterized protein ACA1_000800, partial [Acanthamoeba castellanii str. Neff]
RAVAHPSSFGDDEDVVEEEEVAHGRGRLSAPDDPLHLPLNFQNLQSAYNQKNACLATIPAASTAPAADAATTPARRDVTFPLSPPRMNVVLESLAGCLSERIMENDGNVAEPRLSYLRSCTRVRRPSSRPPPPRNHHVPEEPEEVKSRPRECTPFRQRT